MRILLTGATGSIGRRLVSQLRSRGEEMLGVTRDPGRAAVLVDLSTTRLIEGDPTIPGDWQSAVNGADALIHLACTGLEEHIESEDELEALRERRLDAMFQVITAIEQAQEPPRVLLVLSSVLAASTDSSKHALADLQREFEQEASRASELGVRVVVLRLGLLLDDQGRGLESIAGSGPIDGLIRFIHVEDAAGMLLWALAHETVAGIIDGCTSKPAKIKQMKKQLGRTRRRTPRGEVRAILECNLGSPTSCGYACQFDSFEDVVHNLVVKSARPTELTSVNTNGGTGNTIVVVPCEGLLLEGTSIRPNAVRAVERLRDAGMSVLLATSCGGKLPLELAARLNATDPIIAGDGSALLDPGLREAIRTESLGADRVSAIATAIRTADPRVTIIVERGVHVGSADEGVPPASLRRLTSIDEVLDMQTLFGRPATRLLFYAPARRLERAMEVIRASWWRERVVGIVEYGPDVVSVTAPTADRGVALQRAESLMGVQRGSSIVIAATERDAGLLECAELAFALPTLAPRIATSARSVLASSDPVEVADAIVRAHQARVMRAVSGAR